jgi:protein TonB
MLPLVARRWQGSRQSGFQPMPSIVSAHRQRLAIVVSVLLLHALALWALQTGLLQRLVERVEEVVVPIAVISEPPPAPKPRQLPAPEPAKREPVLKPAPPVLVPPPPPVAPATPLAATAPLAVVDAVPAANAPQGVLHAAAVAAAPAPAPVPKLDLPSSDADYLHNPKPKYPGLSISRNEQGTVRLSVLVGVDGRARDVKIKTSSGFERLDRAARDAVLGWTFVPGKRAGVPEEMWYDLPMPFRLTE